jgi:hypothetical protein
MATTTPPKDPRLDENGFLKPAPFNAALHSDAQASWLLTMAAQGKLSDAQMEACRTAAEGFDKAVAEIQEELGHVKNSRSI